MTGVAAFLAARLDEDEAIARQSGPALVAWLTFRSGKGEMLCTTVAAGGEGNWDPWVADGRELPEPASVRVVYDPARALREIQAKRAILDEHCILTSGDRNPDYEEFPVVPWGAKGGAGDQGPGCVTCHYCGLGGMKGYGICRTVRLLAAIWSDHPDYDQAWAIR
jgi:hypothetical protein